MEKYINKVTCADSLDIMRELPDNCVDLCLTDPPYKIISGGCRIKDNGNDTSGCLNRRNDNKRTDWVDDVRTGKMFKHNDIKFKEWIPEVFRILKEGTHFYVMVNDKNVREMLNVCVDSGLKEVNILVWKKQNSTPNKYYMKNLEFILMFRKGGARNIENMGDNQVFEVDNIIGNKLHPTEKPVDLFKRIIENSSKEGDLILDCFGGSGTTARACKDLNRDFILIEKEQKYCDIANERLRQGVMNFYTCQCGKV